MLCRLLSIVNRVQVYHWRNLVLLKVKLSLRTWWSRTGRGRTALLILNPIIGWTSAVFFPPPSLNLRGQSPGYLERALQPVLALEKDTFLEMFVAPVGNRNTISCAFCPSPDKSVQHANLAAKILLFISLSLWRNWFQVHLHSGSYNYGTVSFDLCAKFPASLTSSALKNVKATALTCVDL